MWGQAGFSCVPVPVSRIIPTRVGTRSKYRKIRVTVWDHPHACGDKPRPLGKVKNASGSSPRVWGQVIFLLPFGLSCGIIPTRVGTSSSFIFLSQQVKDHPHACGDKQIVCLQGSYQEGSSPCVWGQGGEHKQVRYVPGIIPTRVGTRLRELLHIPICQDHPHACGDKINFSSIVYAPQGSSPRVWGQEGS